MIRVASVILPAIAAAALSGCGQLGAGYKGMQPVRPNLQDQRQVARYPDASPQRTVLEWFRALQTNDTARAFAFYAAAARVTPNLIAFERAAGSRYFAQAQLPRIISVWTGSTRATVFTLVDFRWSAPDRRGYVFERPQEFTLQLSRGQWQLADNYFLGSVRYLVPPGPCKTC